MIEYNCYHVDTCLPCYVLDHCNGDDELLMSAMVDGTTTYQDILDELLRELHGAELPEGADYDAAETAIRTEFTTVKDMSGLFDASLDTAEEFELEPCYAWFRLSWNVSSDD